MMEIIKDEVHRCEGCCDAMGPVVFFLFLSASAGCWLALGSPSLGLHNCFGSYQIWSELFYDDSIVGLVPFYSWLFSRS